MKQATEVWIEVNWVCCNCGHEHFRRIQDYHIDTIDIPHGSKEVVVVEVHCWFCDTEQTVYL